MASYTKEELAQMIAQLEDSGQNAGTCITAAMRKDRDWEQMYQKEHTKSNQLQDELDRTKKENNKLYNRIAELTK